MVLSLGFFLLFPVMLQAQTSESQGAVILDIRFFDRRIYYLSESPILVRLTVANNSPQSYHFNLADERAFSIDFDVRSPSNRALESAPSLIRRRTGSDKVFFREITVDAGESFSFVEDLRNYVSFQNSGSFVVQARLYPQLYRGSSSGVLKAALSGSSGDAEALPAAPASPLVSNTLNLNLRPASIPGPDKLPLAMDVETNAILARQKLPPDEVVAYTLKARQKSQWDKFFLYLDLEAMISRDGSRERQWKNESAEGRRAMMVRYKQELQSPTADSNSISTIPLSFDILRTTYNNAEGTVVVLEKFKAGDYTERKQYTYTLLRRDDIWTIVDYVVLNLGTE